MTIYEFTAADVVAKVRELAAEQPDFVYETPGDTNTCANVVEDEDGNWVGSCLVGKAVVALGISAAEIAEWDHEGEVQSLLEKFGIESGPQAEAWLKYVQGFQDDSKPWGLAVRAADYHQPSVADLNSDQIDALRDILIAADFL